MIDSSSMENFAHERNVSAVLPMTNNCTVYSYLRGHRNVFLRERSSCDRDTIINKIVRDCLKRKVNFCRHYKMQHETRLCSYIRDQLQTSNNSNTITAVYSNRAFSEWWQLKYRYSKRKTQHRSDARSSNHTVKTGSLTCNNYSTVKNIGGNGKVFRNTAKNGFHLSKCSLLQMYSSR